MAGSGLASDAVTRFIRRLLAHVTRRVAARNSVNRHETCHGLSRLQRENELDSRQATGPISGTSRRKRTLRTHACRTLAITSCTLIAWTGAFAADGDTFDLQTSISERHDSNFFRLPDGVQPTSGQSRGATTETIGVGLNVNQSYSLQHVSLDALITRNRYRPYSTLDATGRQINGTYNWALTPELTGNLVFNQRVQPTTFADAGEETNPNPYKYEERRLDVDFRPGATLHPRFSVFSIEDKSDRPVFQRESSKSRSAEFSLVWEFRSTNTAAAYVRSARGTYLADNGVASAFSNSQFTEREIGIRSTYRATGESSFNGNLGYLKREHTEFGDRNFAGLVARLTYDYRITGKTDLQLSAARSLGSSQSTFSSHYVADTYGLGVVWAVTGKINVRPGLSVNRQRFKGEVPGSGAVNEQTFTTGVLVDWSVRRWVALSLELARERRTSNAPVLQYRNNAAALTARMRF